MLNVNFERIFKAGDRITICQGQDEYSTIIDEITSPQTISIVEPWRFGDNFNAGVGSIYNAVCATSSGVHRFTVESVGVTTEAGIRTIQLKYVSKYTRVQNRKAYRCQVMLPVEIRKRPRENTPSVKIEKWVKTKTLDISSTGVKLRLESRFASGDVVQMKIHIDKFGFVTVLPLITGIIVRATPAIDSTRDVICGIEFINTDSKVRDALAKFIMICQRNSVGSRE